MLSWISTTTKTPIKITHYKRKGYLLFSHDLVIYLEAGRCGLIIAYSILLFYKTIPTNQNIQSKTTPCAIVPQLKTRVVNVVNFGWEIYLTKFFLLRFHRKHTAFISTCQKHTYDLLHSTMLWQLCMLCRLVQAHILLQKP